MPATNPYSEEEAARIYDLYITQGKSATLTATILQLPSRNAVLGLAFRRGWERDPAHTAKNNSAPKIGKKRQSQRKAPTNPAKPPPAPKATTPPPEAVRPATERQAVTLMALGAGCKWPVAYRDGEHLFCGAHRPLGEVYCVVHKAASIQVRTGGGKFRLGALSVLR